MNSNQNNSFGESIYDLAVKNCSLTSVTIELLTKCNWRCKHCYIPNHDNYGFSKETLIDLFVQLRDLNTFEIIFTGGEIFYRDDMIDIIRIAREMFFEVQLYTNISLLDEEKIKTLSNLYMSKVSCTIFSLDEKVHDSITGVKGSLKKALANIMLIKKYNIPFEIKTILMKENYTSYKEIKKLCDDNGFAYIATTNIFNKIDGDNSVKNLMVSPVQLDEILSDIDIIRGFEEHSHTESDYICKETRYSLAIGCDGAVYPCNNYRSAILGNIYESILRDIWESSVELKKIQNTKWNDLKTCRSCSYQQHCYRCTGIAVLEENDMLAKSALECTHAKARYRLIKTQRRDKQ